MLAQEVMDTAAAYLNDTAKSLYTYSALLPYVKMANEALEKKMLVFGVEVIRVKSDVLVLPAGSTGIVVNAGVGQIQLPSDFLVPIDLQERNSGATNDPWIPMTERTWEPENVVVTNELRYWAFRNNGIYLVGALVDRDILLRYERQLQIINSENTPEDFVMAKDYLASKTAEYCARLVGQNSTFADEIFARYVSPAEDDLEHILTLNQQGLGQRRRRFTTKRFTYIG